MNKHIDPNLNMADDDIIINLAKEETEIQEEIVQNNPETNTKPIAVDPQLSMDIASDLEEMVDAQEKKAEHKSHHSHHSHHHHHSHHSGSHHHSHHHSSSGGHHSSHHSSHSHHSSSSKKSSKKEDEEKKKKKKMPIILRILLILISFILIFAIVTGSTFFFLTQSGKQEFAPTDTDVVYEETIDWKGKTYAFDNDVVTLAFLGIDKRELSDENDPDAGRADAIIVVAVDTTDGTANVIAIPRDTMVDVDVYSDNGTFLNSQNMQICLSYLYGDGNETSCENVITSISRVLYDIPIQKYFALDLNGIAPLNDAIGGVTVQSLYDFSNMGIGIGDTVTLKGDMAEQYVRSRSHTDIEASLNRTDRQVQYIKAYVQQLLPAVLNDFGVISDLYNTATEYSHSNITLSNATYLASVLLTSGVTSFESYTIQGEMKADPATDHPDAVYAQFYPDEEKLMDTIVKVFYDEVE